MTGRAVMGWLRGNFNANPLITLFFGLVAPATIAMSFLYIAHQNGVCISQMRVLSNDEMYRAALLDKPQIDLRNPIFQNLRIVDPEGQRLSEESLVVPDTISHNIEKYRKEYSSIVENKLNKWKLSEDYISREFRTNPSLDTADFDEYNDGPFGTPNFLDIVFGVHPDVVSQRIEIFWVNPSSISPKPELIIEDNKTFISRSWYVTGWPMNVTGPIENRQHIFRNIYMDVCGYRKTN